MKFPPTKDKKEMLFHGFYFLFAAPTFQHQQEVGQMLCVMLMDSEITKEDAEIACSRAIQAHITEKQLEATYNG